MAEPKKNVEKEEEKSKFELLTDEQKERAAELLEAKEAEEEEEAEKAEEKKGLMKKAKYGLAALVALAIGGGSYAAGVSSGKKSAKKAENTNSEPFTTVEG